MPLHMPYVQAPELLVRCSQAAAYDGAKVDVWSLGVALFFMLTKSYPFEIVVKGDETREVAIMRVRVITDVWPLCTVSSQRV